jgi:hypothetical protein
MEMSLLAWSAGAGGRLRVTAHMAGCMERKMMSDFRYSIGEHNGIDCLHVMIDCACDEITQTHIPLDDIEKAIQAYHTQQWPAIRDLSLQCVRESIIRQLGRNPDLVEEVRYETEIKEIPSDSAWKSHIPTGKRWITVVFPDRAFRFVQERGIVELDKDWNEVVLAKTLRTNSLPNVPAD